MTANVVTALAVAVMAAHPMTTPTASTMMAARIDL